MNDSHENTSETPDSRNSRNASAPGLPPVPPLGPDGVTWRSASLGDAEDIHAVALKAGAVDHPYFTVPIEEVVEDLTAISRGEGGGIVAIDEAGRVIAYGMALPFALDSSPLSSLAIGAVSPESRRQGVGRRIIAWQKDQGFAWLASVDPRRPRRILSYVDAEAADARKLLSDAGFTAAREYLHLSRSTSIPFSLPTPTGFTIASLTDQYHEPVRQLRNAAFHDQWGAHSLDVEAWALFIARPVFDESLSRVMLDPAGHVAGYTLVEREVDEQGRHQGASAYLASLGVEQSHRRQGLGAALLGNLVTLAEQHGLEAVTLDVDSASESRANELYFRLGFEALHRRLSYVSDRSTAVAEAPEEEEEEQGEGLDRG